MKSTTKLGLAGLALLTVLGCQGAIQRGVFENYPVEYHEGKRMMSYPNLKIFSREKSGGNILFVDSNYDGRFDSIFLGDVRKGDPVEKYASLQIGQQLLNGFLNIEEQK